MKYDFIFSGVGLAGLMVLNEMLEADLLIGKNILLLDVSIKNENDKTWCFWEDGAGAWDSIVKKEWDRALFINNDKSIDCISGSMKYKMIESLSFYQLIINRLESYPEIIWRREAMVSYEEKNDEITVLTEKTTYVTSFLFNSVFDLKKIQNNKTYPLLHQHFIGWFIKTTSPFFDNNTATFMDFSLPQNGNTRFMYVLPLSTNEALIEYTLFSANLLEEDEYETAIADYLENKGITDFEIIKKEKGNIPMTVYPFWKENTSRVLNIGTAGGWTKASTGYTFKNSVKQSKKVVSFLKKDTVDFTQFYKTNRFTFYDSLFIDVLYKNNELGYDLFSNMFSNVKPEIVFRFLDEESIFGEDLKVILACPKIPFIKALLKKVT